jgi:hypothetical protein
MLKLSDLCYIIRLDAADERFPGGRAALISNHVDEIGRTVFFDEDLIILHAFGGRQKFWSFDNHYEEMGLHLTANFGDVSIAGDRVHYSYQTGWSEHCAWLGVNQWDNTVWLWKEDYWKGTLRLSQNDLACLLKSPPKEIHETEISNSRGLLKPES